MKRTAYGLCLCLAGLLAQPVLAEQVYRWVDADGVVHYTATPPPAGQQAEQMKLKVPKGSPAAPAPMVVRPDASPETGRQASDKAEEQREFAQHQQEQCANARKIIERLGTRPAASYQREDGSYQRYSDEERERMIAEARDFEGRYCN